MCTDDYVSATEFVRLKALDGYENGYTWLTLGYNFVHPSQQGGYIPGGPFVYMTIRTEEDKVRNKVTRDANRAWVNSWVDGINKYVSDNNLDFPIVNRPY